MQLATPIADAIDNYNANEFILNNCIPVITPEESLRQPSPHSNHALWIFGHLIHSRASVLHFLGEKQEWSRPWQPLFVRGAKLVDASTYPAWSELVAAWHEITTALHKALDEVPGNVLDSPSLEGIPSGDKKMSGLVRFFAAHEAYHAGQLGYLTAWLGHHGPVG